MKRDLFSRSPTASADLPPAERNGHVHERRLAETAPAARKAAGVYYTPPALVDVILARTVGKLLRSSKRATTGLRILDLACGAGVFLLRAYRRLTMGRHQLLGLDTDAMAVAIARQSLQQLGADHSARVVRADALLGFDWSADAPFDAVIGNPPWGQKVIGHDEARKCRIRQEYPSSRGIFDLFRPFVELGIRLLRPGGYFGMVLPDIVLLKNYEDTRHLLLDNLTLQHIAWWRMPFGAAVIDVATIVGVKRTAPPKHRIRVEVHDADNPLVHDIPQADFRANPRLTFNLHLTPAKRAVLRRLDDCPRLGDFFEIHEGVHSGNMRAELFVSDKVDASCHELYVGRGEIAPYRLTWAGKFLRPSAMPARKTPDRYANLGRPEWHEQPKVLVRRTGDRVLAAVDRGGRYASNNFFLVFPRRACTLDLDGLCAVLNSNFMTWYFRTIEPRQGRVFAELKIKHLAAFPLPLGDERACRKLNRLGKKCVRAREAKVETEIEKAVRSGLGMVESVVND